MSEANEFVSLLQSVQEYISKNYAAALTETAKLPQLKTYIEKYLRDRNIAVEGFTSQELVDKLYCEMAECATRS